MKRAKRNLVVIFVILYALISVYAILQGNLIHNFRVIDSQPGDSHLGGRLAEFAEVDEQDTNLEVCGQTNPIRYNNDASHDGRKIYYHPPLPPNLVDNNSTSSLFRIAQKPLYGEHRCDKNAVMAFAHGYQLPQLIHFITSLSKTGYDGDVVIGVGTNLTQETRSSLEYHAKNRAGLVVYETPLSCQRKNSCQVAGLLEQTNTVGKKAKWTRVVDDHPFRRVSVVRYEYYWA
jgi:hypothetical protein